MGRSVEVPETPSRIISLVPSQTELLYELGVGDKVVGITEYCVHPEHWLREKRIIGGTKNTVLKRVEQLEPDLVIGNKEENTKKKIEKLEERYPVWMSDVQNIQDALDMIQEIGGITDRSEKAEALAERIGEGFEDLQERTGTFHTSTAYFIWKDPWMLAAADTFIDAVLSASGHENPIKAPFPASVQERIDAGKASSRYPIFELEALKEIQPERIYLSSEPYPFGDEDRKELQGHFPHADIRIVDGEMFSWYGSRLEKALPYLEGLIEDRALH
ncbi:MAG: helical backbone metal receptor [Flavobacteriales bacterium]